MPIRWGTNTLYAGSVLLGKGLIAIKWICLLLGFNLGMFLMLPHGVKQLLFSGLNRIPAPSYLSRGSLGELGLNWAKMGPITNRVKF